MYLREELEEREYKILSPFACKARESKGRAFLEAKDEVRTDFQRDRDRVIHSKAFRRLMHKTQVFLAPEGDHYRTRLTHTLEVAQIARTISRALGLNEDLTEAIALGHDLGHTPFGHNGEAFLNQKHPAGFSHNIQSLRVADVLERNSNGRTMNLTDEVRDGIVNHSGPNMPYTLEGKAVRISDRIAYINHDIDDAIRAGIFVKEELPRDCIAYLGSDHGKRINSLVIDIVKNSDGKNSLSQSKEAAYYMGRLRDFMFERVYNSAQVKRTSDMKRIKEIIFSLYDYFLENPELLPDEEKSLLGRYEVPELVKDHIASMTDRYAENEYRKIFG